MSATQKIDPTKTAVLVVDMANDFVAPGAPIFVEMGYKMAPKLADFLDECRKSGALVIYTTQTYRKDGADISSGTALVLESFGGSCLIEGTNGAEIYPVCAPKENDILIKKQFYSAFYCTGLDVILRAKEIKTVVITGVCTDSSCFTTARDAFYLDYDVIILHDLNGARQWPDCGYGVLPAEIQHIAALTNLAESNGSVMSSEEFSGLIK